MIKTISLTLFLLLAISCNQNKIKLVKKYERLHNTHSVESALSLYDDDIKFELVGTWIKSGKKEIGNLEEWDKALNSNLKFESFELKGDSVFCKVIEKNDWFRAIGIEQIIHDPTIFIVSEGLIKKIIANPSKEVGKEIGSKIGSIYSWSDETNDSTIHKLIKKGQFIYSDEAAKSWLKLLDKWNNYNISNKIN
jgi:hypothetical protein